MVATTHAVAGIHDTAATTGRKVLYLQALPGLLGLLLLSR